jgi:hypothetical protein
VTGILTVALVILVMLALILLTVLPSYLRRRLRGGTADESWELDDTKAERQQRVREFDAVDRGDFTGRHGRHGDQGPGF